MPPPRKVDLLPEELRAWLKDELKVRGFADYLGLAQALNDHLEETGSELRLSHRAVHAFGAEYREFVKVQEEASAWAQDWMQDMGLEDQAQRHNVLFQMLTTLAFKTMQAEITKEGSEIDPKNLHFIGRMMKDVMQSSGVVQAMRDKERKEQVAKLDAAVASGDIDAEAAAKARRIMGFA